MPPFYTEQESLMKRTKTGEKTEGRAQYRTHEKHRENTEMAETLLSTARDHKIESKKKFLRAKSTLNITD